MAFGPGRLAAVLATIAGSILLMAADDPPLGGRWVEGLATHDRLWLRSEDGAVVEIDRASHAQHVLASSGVIDMARKDQQLLVLRRSSGRTNVYEIVDLTGRGPSSPLLRTGAQPIALFAGGASIVLTQSALFRLDGGNWRKVALSEPLRRAPQIAIASNSAGTIYIGFNRGEWGGGMQAVDETTGMVSEVRRIDGDVCNGPLGQECDPVTGLVRDPSRPECVLASVGLSHFLADGRILRVCGKGVEVVFSETIPPPPGSDRPKTDGSRQPVSTWPFFGLASTTDGWAAVSYGRLFVSSAGTVTSRDTPAPEKWQDLYVAPLADDLMAVVTDLNAGMSLSGYTPLLVSVGE
jgi:hypothetical protein